MGWREVPWGLKDLLLVHFFRLFIGYVTIRFVYPLLFSAPPPMVEITDRLVVVGLVWFSLWRHGTTPREWGLTLKRWPANVAAGVGAGLLLLCVSLFSERLYTTLFLLTPTQHPLLVQVAAAVTWRDLLIPLLLAGVAAPVAEEMLYRLFTFSALQARYGVWGGGVLSAAIFALFHFNAYWLAEMLVVGLGLALLYYYTRSLLSAIVAHSVVNTAKVLMLFYHISF